MKLTTQSAIKDWLDTYRIFRYIIHENLTVDVNGDVFLDSEDISEIPFQFNHIAGVFNIANTCFKTLENVGLPRQAGRFVATDNHLTSLKGCPDAQFISVQRNQLTDLFDVPPSCQELDVSHNEITHLCGIEHANHLTTIKLDRNPLVSLKGLPQFVTHVEAENCLLKDTAGLPQTVSSLALKENQITRLINLPENLYMLDLSDNYLTTLEGLPRQTFYLNVSNNEIKDFSALAGKKYNVNTFDCSKNPLISLAYFPECHNLSLSSCHLTDDILATYKNIAPHLNVYHNDLKQPVFPMVLESLNIANNPIVQIHGLRNVLTTLDFTIDSIDDCLIYNQIDFYECNILNMELVYSMNGQFDAKRFSRDTFSELTNKIVLKQKLEDNFSQPKKKNNQRKI